MSSALFSLRFPLRHFLDLSELSQTQACALLTEALRRKRAREGFAAGQPDADAPLRHHVVATLFEKPSTRTRVSFDIALRQLGGEALILSAHELQMGRGESLSDTARVLSGYVDGIVVRTFGHERLLEMAQMATVPVVNGLTDSSHPCQILADIITFQEHCGPIANRVITWCGDMCNVAYSWVHACALFDFELRLCHPPTLPPAPDVLAWAFARGARLVIEPDPDKAAQGADCLVTDTWFSMNEARTDKKIATLHPYQVNGALMARANPGAVFLHCLPCHRGEEVTAEVIDGPRSRVFEQAENRVHAQKAVLLWCFGKLAQTV